MSGPFSPSAVTDVWPRIASSSATSAPSGRTPGGLTPFPSINNPILPSNPVAGVGGAAPPVPQPPLTPFPSLQRPANSLNSNIYATTNTTPSLNPVAVNLAQAALQNSQNEAQQRRLMLLEEENAQRRTAAANLTQMGTQLLQGQMDVQEQVLQYQFMLEQCMETLDNQNYALNEQAEELALLRAKMRHFEYLMEALKFSKEGNQLMKMTSDGPNLMQYNQHYCGDPFAVPPPPTSRYFAGAQTRVTPSTFQPFNPRYRSPESRATAAANLEQHRSETVAANRNRPTANERPSRRLSNVK